MPPDSIQQASEKGQKNLLQHYILTTHAEYW